MEFQAIVMAGGKGSRMTELTTACQKCILPIGSYPLIWYPLNMLERMGFQEVIVVVPETAKMLVAAIPEKYSLNIFLDVVGIPVAEDWGTADSLRHIHEKIQSDVMVLSCDLVTDLPICNLVDLHRLHQASLTALFSSVTPDPATLPVPGPKSRHKSEKDLVGVDHTTSRLCFLASEADFDEYLTLRKSLLRKHPRVTVHSKFMDAHFYIMKKWVVDYITDERCFSTLKGELIPHLVRKQFSKPPQSREKDIPHPTASVISVSTKKEICHYAEEDSVVNQIRHLSFWNDHHGDMHEAYHGDHIRCYAYVMKEGFCMRANTLAGYCELNRQISRRWTNVTSGVELLPIHPNSQVHPDTQVGSDCLIGDGTRIAEKTSVKHCVIGQHCKIDEKVKLTNCIIMDYVSIKEGCSLQGTVVCSNATINQFCILKDCLVGNGKNIDSERECTSEVLMDDTMYVALEL